jgi:hypothetical protein
MKAKFISALVVLSLFAFSSFSQAPHPWDVNILKPATEDLQIWRGESVSLSPRFKLNSLAWPISTSATVSLFWSTNNFASAIWATNGAICLTETGRVTAVWTPACDIGAWQYQYFVGVSEPSGLLYRARGTITMRSSPGWQPSINPLPAWDGWTNNYLYVTWSAITNEASLRAAADRAGQSYADQAASSAVTVGRSFLCASGDIWRTEWHTAAGASAEVARIAATNQAAIDAAACYLSRTGGTVGTLAITNGLYLNAMDIATSWRIRHDTNSGSLFVETPDTGRWTFSDLGPVNRTVASTYELGLITAASLGAAEISVVATQIWDRTQYPDAVFYDDEGIFDPAGAAESVQSNLTTHTNRFDNPHAVTATQIGAITNHQTGITLGLASGSSISGYPTFSQSTNIVAQYAAPSFPIYDYGTHSNVTFVLSNNVLYLYGN